MIDAAWLRGLGEAGLVGLLTKRPEVLAPPVPASLTEVAERLATPRSTMAALRRLDRPALQVAEAIAALGGHTERVALDRLLGATSARSRAHVARALDTLRDNALLTAAGPTVVLVPSAAAWPSPLGLGVPVAEAMDRRTADDLRALARNLGLKPATRKAELLTQVLAALRDGNLVCAVVDDAPAEARELLYKVAATGETVEDYLYFSPGYERARTPVQWAIAHGLLARAGDWESGLTMPAEVALALRGDGYTAPFDPVPPAVDRTQPTDPEVIARDAAAAGSAMVRLVAALLDEAGRAPLATLRSGDIGTREVRRLTKRLGCAEPDLRLALALAIHAELLSLADGHAAPTTGYDRWLRHEPADRLAELLAAWWRLPYAPLAADRAITTQEHADGTAALRAALLGTAAVPPAAAVTDPAALVARVVWQQPFGFGDPDTAPLRALACWHEAGLLGAVAVGAVSAAGRALLGGADDLTTALGDIGTAERTVRLQADLTAVVAGTPTPELAALLDLAADIESRGTASTWRFSPASVRRALDAGYPATGLLAELTAVAAATLPQPLEYLITDVARRHGAVRASTVTCCLRSDDTALLAEIAADRRLRALGLRHLAPTVLAADTPLTDTLAALRKAGYAPVAETADGTPVIERATAHRATAHRTGTPTRPGTKAQRAEPAPAAPATRRRTAAPDPDPAKLARTLLAAPDDPPAASSPSLPSVRAAAVNLTAGEARILAHAIDHHRPVAIEYLNREGNPSSRVIGDLELSGTALSAWCRLRDDHRWFNLGRIIGVEPVTEPLA
jgi:hypothetical protein